MSNVVDINKNSQYVDPLDQIEKGISNMGITRTNVELMKNKLIRYKQEIIRDYNEQTGSDLFEILNMIVNENYYANGFFFNTINNLQRANLLLISLRKVELEHFR